MAKKRQYTFIDLFAGCGGLSEGFMESGHFKGLAHIEWEYPMVQTLRNRLVKKWNETCEQAQKKVILFDIQRTDELLFGNWTQESIKQYAKYNSVETQKGLKHMLNGKTVDLIIGGPPCQAYSIHGRATDKNSMQNDYRNYLFESFVKVVDEIRPKAFIFENVTGMLSAKPGGKPVVERIYKAVTDIGYFIPRPLYENFIKMFVSFAPNVSVQASTDRPNRKNGILQQIFYGAPGTGKSHTIEEETKEEDVIRITFHPDTDYSTFVGAYKPTTALLPICDELGQPMKIGTTTLHKEQIVYEFVAQSFLQAYVNAWEKYDKGDKQYLVIEEINRGNCAQIFGDLFQLLDRNDYGFSDYPIKADADMKRQLQKAFAGLVIAQKDKINAMYEGKDIVSQVLNGNILLLPNNLYIWATMNTSDQSLFPIDSAFKRRWDWTYMPISNAEKDWIIEVDGSKYDWWQFLEKINEKIGSTTNLEDKKLGYFFCKAQDGVISAKTFVGKVIFYLWNDVFKDYEFGDAIFNDEDGSKLSFDKFYTSEGKNSKVVEEKVALFFKNLGLIPIEISKEESEIEDEDGNTPESNSRNYDKFTVNDGAECAKNKLAIECIKEYIKLNPDITAQEVYEKWTSLGSIVPHFIETKEQFDSRTDNSKRSDAVDCYGIPIYVARNGYGSNGKADILMKLVNEKNWGITIKKIIK